MSTYNNQLWAKMVTDWVMSGPHSSGAAAGENSARHSAAVSHNDREANASSQQQPTSA